MFLGSGHAPRPVVSGDGVFPPDSLWVGLGCWVRVVLYARFSVRNYLLFLHSLNNSNLIFTYYSIKTSRCVLNETNSYQCTSNSQIIHFTHTHKKKIHDKVDGQKITEDALKLKIVWWFPAIVYKFSHVIHFKHGRYTYWKIIQKSSEFGPRRSNDWIQYWTHIDGTKAS